LIKASHILEEYHALLKTDYVSVPIFLNPTRSDFKEMGNDVRFIADARSKKLYAWDANIVIHIEVSDFLHLGLCSPTRFWGYAVKHGSKYVLIDSDELVAKVNNRYYLQHYLDKFFATDWTWIDKYLDASSFFNFIKDFMSSNDKKKYLTGVDYPPELRPL